MMFLFLFFFQGIVINGLTHDKDEDNINNGPKYVMWGTLLPNASRK